jgi:Holliday junction resolvase RusA-like endonuclease
MIDIRHFIVPGRPCPKERPRFFRGKAITPMKTQHYEAIIRNEYQNAHGDKTPYECDLEVGVFVFLNDRRHGDCDNYAKVAQDALNKIAWKDDKLIKQLTVYLVIDKKESTRLEMVIQPLNDSFRETIQNQLESHN